MVSLCTEEMTEHVVSDVGKEIKKKHTFLPLGATEHRPSIMIKPPGPMGAPSIFPPNV